VKTIFRETPILEKRKVKTIFRETHIFRETKKVLAFQKISGDFLAK